MGTVFLERDEGAVERVGSVFARRNIVRYYVLQDDSFFFATEQNERDAFGEALCRPLWEFRGIFMS